MTLRIGALVQGIVNEQRGCDDDTVFERLQLEPPGLSYEIETGEHPSCPGRRAT